MVISRAFQLLRSPGDGFRRGPLRLSLNSIGYFAQILPPVQAGMLRRLRESVDDRLADQNGAVVSPFGRRR
jgi:hypothetical protein